MGDKQPAATGKPGYVVLRQVGDDQWESYRAVLRSEWRIAADL
jgi:hypothetical protein